MPWDRRRTLQYLALVLVATVAFTFLYNVGMNVWEDRPQPVYRSLQVVFQSFTTTGYGEDAPWSSPYMNLLAVTMQITGIGLILTGVDVFAVPWLQEAVRVDPPSATQATDHVVVCKHTQRGDAFVDELTAREQEYVIVEPDQETAIDLHDDGYNVVCGDPESVDVLARAGVDRSRAVVADAADDTNASIVLSARELAPDTPTITIAEDDELADYHRAAGASTVLSPRQLLGESLARRVRTPVSARADEGVEIGDDVELVEVSVDPDSPVCNRTFEEARLRDRFEVNVVGAWRQAEFETPIDPDAEITADTTLLVAGQPDHVQRLREELGSRVQRFSDHHVVLAGFGDSGAAAHAELADTAAEVTIVDMQAREGVDVVGDARDPQVLRRAGIEQADTLVLTLADDTTAILTTLIACEVQPELEVIVRANVEETVEKLYRAGADYVQALPTVCGRMLASTVFEDEQVLSYETHINVVRQSADALAGSTLAGEQVRSRTGCTVLAVERAGRTITDVDPDGFVFEAEDRVILAGTDEAVSRFERELEGD
jgi:Trk K+ transport system NAD-binding subunit